MHNVRLYILIVHTMIWACQNTSDKYAKTIEKHEKNQTFHEILENMPAFRGQKTIFVIPFVLSVCFFWSNFENFRVIGGDAERDRIF